MEEPLGKDPPFVYCETAYIPVRDVVSFISISLLELLQSRWITLSLNHPVVVYAVELLGKLI